MEFSVHLVIMKNSTNPLGYKVFEDFFDFVHLRLVFSKVKVWISVLLLSCSNLSVEESLIIWECTTKHTGSCVGYEYKIPTYDRYFVFSQMVAAVKLNKIIFY